MDAAVSSAVPPIQRIAAHQMMTAGASPFGGAGQTILTVERSSMSLISEGAEFAHPVANAAALNRHEPSIASVGDYIALMKPRVMSLVVFTAFVGMMIAPGHIHPVIGFAALLCISVAAGAAAAP